MAEKLKELYFVEFPHSCDAGNGFSVYGDGFTYAGSPQKATANIVTRMLLEKGFPRERLGIVIDRVDAKFRGLENCAYEFPRVESADGNALNRDELDMARTMALAENIAHRRNQSPGVIHMQEARRILDRFYKQLSEQRN